MKKPEKLSTYHFKHAPNSRTFNLGYNSGLEDMEACHNWRMAQLPSIDEIFEELWTGEANAHLYTISRNYGQYVEPIVRKLAKALHKRIHEVKEEDENPKV